MSDYRGPTPTRIDIPEAYEHAPLYVPDKFAEEHFLTWAPVGSRVSCDPPPAVNSASDHDWLVLCEDVGVLLRLISEELGWDAATAAACHERYAEHPEAATQFYSIRREKVNLLLTDDLDFYHRFLTATHVASQLNVKDRADRVTLFQAVLYGKTHIQKNTEKEDVVMRIHQFCRPRVVPTWIEKKPVAWLEACYRLLAADVVRFTETSPSRLRTGRSISLSEISVQSMQDIATCFQL